jgi:nucleotide-binding universal stress UspA family protein
MPEPNIETILVGDALTPGSDRVVVAARDLARSLGGQLRLLHAVPRPADLVGLDGGVEALWRQRRSGVERALTEHATRLGIDPSELSGISCEQGVAHRLLVETARQGGADLVVVGAHEGVALSGVFGATAARVLRYATRPVLVVRGELNRPPARVLLPVDLSPLSADAFRAGLDLVTRWAGGSVEAEALFVLTDVDRRSHEAAGPGDAREASVAALFRFVAAHRGDFAGEIAQRVAEGEPRAEILQRIAVNQPGLVVLGTHGRSGFELLLMGSVAEGVVREAGCSCLVIPPDAALRAALAREAAARELSRGGAAA